MPSIKDLKKRITTVKNTQQTTKAMKMVSAAKLRRAQDAILATRPYAKTLGEFMLKVSRLSGGTVQSAFLETAERPKRAAGAKNKLFLVLVTSDRGLCGAFNSNAIRTLQRWVEQNKDNYESIQLGHVGRRGYDFYKTKKYTQSGFVSEFGGKVEVIKARDLTQKILEKYLSGDADEVKIIYNEFKNVISQKTIVEDFLPLATLPLGSSEIETKTETPDDMTIVKPSHQELMDRLLEKHFSIQFLRILLESQAGEHGARMSAMENATKNAGEMIRKLTLQYNKQRQAGITKELLEIIAGSESQNTEQ